jgi:para-aminobenzoate synthetase component 1
MIETNTMREIKISPNSLVLSLLSLSEFAKVCILDSCNDTYPDSHLLIAGINPVETLQFSDDDFEKSLEGFNKKLIQNNFAGIFTIAYDFGLKLEKMKFRKKEFSTFPEPDIFLAVFDCLIIHGYSTGKTFLNGNSHKFDEVIKQLFANQSDRRDNFDEESAAKINVQSNFSKKSYLQTVEKIQEYIRSGDTYQTNLTQQFRGELPDDLTARKIFWRLKKYHPAPFSAFLNRIDDTVISASPERFCAIKNQTILCSPIKGTRQRGKTENGDELLKRELLSSAKDRAENIMIVDLLRNDIGKVCRYGSVKVEKLCILETYPTYHHLVSTIRGDLKNHLNFGEIIKAIFPCGSITGAPKINTMHIIDRIETVNRGLSMGAIGYVGFDKTLQMSVAIRTLVVRNNKAVFNVGGGIVIDSDPESEYEESLVKAQAIFSALGTDKSFIHFFND